jgi:hypothetical protein
VRRIAVIGGGHLGSRHLQALARMSDASIWVVDPSETALATCRNRYEEAADRGAGNALILAPRIGDVPRDLDLGVIATNSDVRRAVIERLLRESSVGALILEKVLFQRLEDFEAIAVLLKKSGTRAWVNCARRMHPAYRELKEAFWAGGLAHLSVLGSDWGLAGNSIHFLDLISFLAETTECRIDGSRLSPRLVSSKRAGFLEVHGTLAGTFAGEVTFQFTSLSVGSVPLILEAAGPDLLAVIKQQAQSVQAAFRKDGWRFEERPFPLMYQSGLTHLAAEQILSGRGCELTPYDDSVKLHEPLLGCLLSHFRRSGYEAGDERCPIT